MILNKKIVKSKVLYLIKWKDSWELEFVVKTYINDVNKIKRINSEFGRPYYLVKWNTTWETTDTLIEKSIFNRGI